MKICFTCKTAKVIFSALAVILFCLSFSTSKQKITQAAISKVNFIYKLPIVQLKGELKYLHDSVSIFYTNNAILYQFPYTSTTENKSSITKNERWFHYFVFKKKESFGYYFDTLKAVNYRIRNVDSLLQIKMFGGVNFFDSKNDSLIITIKNKEGYNLIEQYIPKSKPDPSYADTTIFYFDKQVDGIMYSFSNELETQKNLKISRVRIIYNKVYSTAYNIILPAREFDFIIQKDTINKSPDIIRLFELIEIHTAN